MTGQIDKKTAWFSAASLLAGIGWNMANLKGNFIAALLVLIAAVLAVWAIRDLSQVARRLLFLPFGKLPMPIAATIAYEDLSDTVWVTAARYDRGSANDTLDYFAVALSNRVELFGKGPASTFLEAIPRKEIKRRAIKGGGSVLEEWGSQHPTYRGLSVRRRDLKRAIRVLRQESDAILNQGK